LCPPKLLMREVMDRLRRFLWGLSIVVAGLLAVTPQGGRPSVRNYW